MNASSFSQFLDSGHVWLYVPVAVLLGALHGLEPGHSKTMMAAFIIAIRGTIMQAVLLGVSAALSHSLIIWVLAALALNYGNKWDAEAIEPVLQLVSGGVILALAIWMFLRTRREVREAAEHEHHHPAETAVPPSVPEVSASPAVNDEDNPWLAQHHHHGHQAAAPVVTSVSGLILPPGYESNPGTTLTATPETHKRGQSGGLLLDTGHGWLEISVSSDAEGSRFRVRPCKASGAPVPLPKGTQVQIETARLDGTVQKFLFEPREAFWESTAPVPEPRRFLATVILGHSDHSHRYKLRFDEEAASTGGAAVEEVREAGDDVYQDAHERAHAEDIARRFANRRVTTPQIILFGITGGLMPCPAAVTILLVCLQLKRAALGFSIVGAFSFGLALTMVSVGAVAAWSVQHAQRRFEGFGNWMRRAPYVSCVLLVGLASYMVWEGWHGLAHGHAH